MIVAVGTDLVDVARLARRLEHSPALARRLFTPAERGACAGEPAAAAVHLAARLAAKEAALKVLGSALDDAARPVPPGWTYQEAEVASAPGTPPRLVLHGTLATTAASLGVRRWHLSLSHDAGAALAFLVAES